MKRCDSCGELKESPEDFAIFEEQDDNESVHICWGCHDDGRTIE
jgi:predicted CXXCH cytochrome family protein